MLCTLLVVAAAATPLDDYVSKPEPVYAFFDTGATVKPTLSTSTAHILNVTSLKWLDESRASGPNGAIWTQCVLNAPSSPNHVPDSLTIC